MFDKAAPFVADALLTHLVFPPASEKQLSAFAKRATIRILALLVLSYVSEILPDHVKDAIWMVTIVCACLYLLVLIYEEKL